MSHAGKPGSRRLVTLLACCVLVAAWLQTVPLSAGADTPPWVQQSSPEFIPAAISCVSGSDFCMAVGINEDGPGADTTAPVAESWNGSSWTVTTMPSLNVQTYLTGVSCTSLAQCVAVGYTSETSGGSYLVPQLPTEPLAENLGWHVLVNRAGAVANRIPAGRECGRNRPAGADWRRAHVGELSGGQRLHSRWR